MDIAKAIAEQRAAMEKMSAMEVYSPEWWQALPDTVTLVPPEMRQAMVFAVVFGSIQM